MSAVWKKPLALTDGGQAIFVEHQGILHVGGDPNGVPCVWFWAPENAPVTSRVLVVGTGRPIEAESVDKYIGSFVYRTLMLHAFQQDVKQGNITL